MRTLHQIEILEKIYNNPYEYIGQRNFNLLYCFMLGNFEKEIEKSHETNNELKKMPSFRKFVESKTSIKLTSSVSWSWALGFIAENQQDLFSKYFELLFEYEKLYPFDYSKVTYKKNYRLNFFIENIKAISERPAMFSIIGISSIRAYLDGAIFFKKQEKISFSSNEQKIIDVVNSYKSKLNPELKFETWDRVLLREKMNINELTMGNFPNTWAMMRFFEVLEGESNLKLKSWEELKNSI